MRHGRNVAALIDEYDLPVTNGAGRGRFPRAVQTEAIIERMYRFCAMLQNRGDAPEAAGAR